MKLFKEKLGDYFISF